MLNRIFLIKTMKTVLFIICFFACGTVAAAQCKGWTYQFDGNLKNWYLDRLKSNCDTYTIKGVPDTLGCYWSYVNGACFGYMLEAEKNHNDANNKPFQLMPSQIVNATERNCWYKYANNNGGPFLLGPTNYIDVAEQPFQSHCSDEMQNQLQGPYRNCPDNYERPHGGYYTKSQKQRIKYMNFKKNNNKLVSDLCDVTVCDQMNNCMTETCEPLVDPQDKFYPVGYKDKMAQIHHITPRKDRQGCNCGRNAYKNALVISAKMNRFLTNLQPPDARVTEVTNITPYPCPTYVPPPGKWKNVLSLNTKQQSSKKQKSKSGKVKSKKSGKVNRK